MIQSSTRSLTVSFAIAILCALSGCKKSSLPKHPTQAQLQAQAAQSDWAKFSSRFIEEYFKAQPFFAAQSGRHEFDGQMPDLSAAGIQREIVRLHGARAELEAVDTASLPERQRFQRDYLLSVVDGDLFWLEKAKFPFKNPAWYVGRLDPDIYLNRNYAPLEVRLRAYIAYARTIPEIAADIRANLRTPLPRSYVEYGIAAFGGFADFYRNDVAAIFASVQDAELQKQLAEADAAAAKAMTELKDWLTAERKNANEAFALGKDLFMQMLRDTEAVGVPLEKIEAEGRSDLERNLAALKAECDFYLPRRPLTDCIAKMASDKPPGSVVERARAQLASLKEFIERNDVATIPTKEDALVAEAPPYNRSNSAYINVPGPYDQGVPSIFYIAPPDPKWSQAEQEAYIPGQADLLFTSVHEVWPGHFLQFLHSNSNSQKVESIWVGYGFAEGWAHYAEEMMVEMGFGQKSGRTDPEIHIGQLANALLRDVRLLSAIGLHTRGMSLDESEKMFREQAFQDPGNARQQAARGTYDPAYLNYTLAKMMIRKLRDDWVKQRGGVGADQKKMWREFHDQFLSYGGPPIPLLRRQLLGEKVEADSLL